MEPAIRIQQAYAQFLTEQGRRPTSVQAFVRQLGEPALSATDFFAVFASFEALEASIFESYFREVAQKLETDATYQAYPASQRLAAIYFTWIERLRQSRSLLLVMRDNDRSWGPPSFIDGAKGAFKDLVGALIREGIDEEQVADRFFVTQFYPQTLWTQARFLIHYWLHDTSKEFQRTDAAVEKVVRFTFDLLSPNLVDSGWDLLRFLSQGK